MSKSVKEVIIVVGATVLLSIGINMSIYGVSIESGGASKSKEAISEGTKINKSNQGISNKIRLGGEADLALSDYAVLAIAIATIIYTVGTFLLWKTTKESLVLMKNEFLNTRKQTESGFVANTTSLHRDIYSIILSDNELLKLFAGNEDIDLIEVKHGLIGTLLINNVMQAFYHYKNSLINEDIWNIIASDTKELFKLKIINERGDEIRNISSQDFKDFIDTQILDSKKTPDISKNT